MKAIVYTEFGSPDVLQITELEKPVPKRNEVRVRVRATSVNYGDITARNFKNTREFNMPFLFWFLARSEFGFYKPKKQILGNEFAGEVEAVGKDVKLFKAGNQIFGYLGARLGAYAEYICIPETACLALKPSNMNFEEAAAIPYGAVTALNLLQKTGLQPGRRVLIIGASGSIGSAALQLAKNHYGADVTGVCSTRRQELVKSLGADKVVDYTKEDFAKTGDKYDLILDVLGRSSWSQCKEVLSPGGKYFLVSFRTKQLLQSLTIKQMSCALSGEKREDLVLVRELIESGKLRSMIEEFPIDRAAEAHRHVENGLHKAKVVLTFDFQNQENTPE